MVRNDRSFVFAQRFIDQWLHIRDLGANKAPDASAYPLWTKDADLRGDITLQPIYFFREMLIRDMPILDLIDSKVHNRNQPPSQAFRTETSAERELHLAAAMGRAARGQPSWRIVGDARLCAGRFLAPLSHQPCVTRRLYSRFDTRHTPPPPPADVPPLERNKEGGPAKTSTGTARAASSQSELCRCHSRIDPLGFALENYDVMGKWRDEESGKPVDSSGEMNDGTKINGPDALKAAILERAMCLPAI
jgi:hypothetical protein